MLYSFAFFHSFVHVLFRLVIRCAGRLLVLQPGIQSDWQCKIVVTRRRSKLTSLARNYRCDVVTLSSSPRRAWISTRSTFPPVVSACPTFARKAAAPAASLSTSTTQVSQSVSQSALVLPCFVCKCLNWLTFSYLTLFCFMISLRDCSCYCRGGGGGRARREDREGLGWPRKRAHGRALVRSRIPTQGRRQYQGKRKYHLQSLLLSS